MPMRRVEVGTIPRYPALPRSPVGLMIEANRNMLQRVQFNPADVAAAEGPKTAYEPPAEGRGSGSTDRSKLLPIGGSMAGKTWDDVPRHGGSPESRMHGGPRGGGRHAGVDIPAKVGDPVFMRDGGVVIRTGSGQGYGNMVDVRAPDGSIHRFAHLNSLADLKAGQMIEPGTTIGTAGHTGNATADFPHVHLEVFPNGDAYNQAKSVSSRQGWNLRVDPLKHYTGQTQVAGNGGKGGQYDKLIQDAAARHGLDPAMLKRMVQVESGGKADAQTGSYKGLLQISEAEHKKHGDGGSIWDPASNLNTGAKKMAEMGLRFEKEFGRKPEAIDYYMMHQQGEAGYRSHLRNPDAPAFKNMSEASKRGDAWGRKAIWGNLTPEAQRRFGNVDAVTGRQFVDFWRDRLAKSGDSPMPMYNVNTVADQAAAERQATRRAEAAKAADAERAAKAQEILSRPSSPIGSDIVAGGPTRQEETRGIGADVVSGGPTPLQEGAGIGSDRGFPTQNVYPGDPGAGIGSDRPFLTQNNYLGAPGGGIGSDANYPSSVQPGGGIGSDARYPAALPEPGGGVGSDARFPLAPPTPGGGIGSDARFPSNPYPGSGIGSDANFPTAPNPLASDEIALSGNPGGIGSDLIASGGGQAPPPSMGGSGGIGSDWAIDQPAGMVAGPPMVAGGDGMGGGMGGGGTAGGGGGLLGNIFGFGGEGGGGGKGFKPTPFQNLVQMPQMTDPNAMMQTLGGPEPADVLSGRWKIPHVPPPPPPTPQGMTPPYSRRRRNSFV